MTSGDDELAQVVMEGLAGVRRCPLCHEGLMVRLLIPGCIVNGKHRPPDPGWECRACLFLMLDDETNLITQVLWNLL